MTQEKMVKELELTYMTKKFMDALMVRGYSADEVFMELMRMTITLHIQASREKYPEITDQTIAKLFADYAGEGCKCILRDVRMGG